MSTTTSPPVNVSRVLIIAAVVVWALDTAGVLFFGMSGLEEATLGLALYGAASLV